jgi:hypothetical protein
VASLVEVPGLPKTGLLQFFAPPNVFEEGLSMRYGGAFVAYLEARTATSVAEPPGSQFTGVSFELVPWLTIPHNQSYDYELLNFDEDEADSYDDLYSKVSGDGFGRRSLFLGHPDLLQSDLGREAEIIFREIPYDASAFDIVQRADGVGWRLLLQLGSELEAGMEWGDVGCLYFMVREQDLIRRDWSKVVCIGAC